MIEIYGNISFMVKLNQKFHFVHSGFHSVDSQWNFSPFQSTIL